MSTTAPDNVLAERGVSLTVAGAVGVALSAVAATAQSSLWWMVVFLAGAVAFGIGSWYSLPLRRGKIEPRLKVYLAAGAFGLFDASVLAMTHADLHGWETLFIAAHYLVGTAFLMTAADGLRRATGN